MWRTLGMLAAVGALGILVTSHGTSSAQPPDGQLICHVAGPKTFIISVPSNAVAPHLAHDDCLINSTDTELIGDPCNNTDANNNDICDIQP